MDTLLEQAIAAARAYDAMVEKALAEGEAELAAGRTLPIDQAFGAVCSELKRRYGDV